jgi:signal transduction histidine kinase
MLDWDGCHGEVCMMLRSVSPTKLGAFRHLRGRLMPQLIAALTLPALLVGILTGTALIESRRAALLAQEQRRAAQAGEAVALLFEERVAAAQRVVQLLTDRQILAAQLETFDRQGLQLFLTSTRGDTLFECLTVHGPTGEAIASDGSCTDIRATSEPVITVTQPDRALVVQVRSPIRRDAQLLGQLVGQLRLDQGLIAVAQQQSDLELSLLVAGAPVATSLPQRLESPAALESPLTDTEDLVIGRAHYLAHYRDLLLNDQLAVVAEVLLPLERIRAAQAEATQIILATTLTAVLLAGLLGWLLARRISRPVNLLCSVAEQIGAGNLGVPIPLAGPTELRELGRSFDQMRAELSRNRVALEAEQRRYVGILESVEEAVLTVRSSNMVSSINRGGEAMFGWPRDQVDGRSLGQVVCLDDGSTLQLDDIPRSGQTRLAVRSRTGRKLTISATRSTGAYDAQEQILVLRDVSDDAAARQLKDAFLANVTHEFQTPLAALIASLEILRDEDAHLTSAERRTMLDALQSGVQRLNTLVQNLLDSASIEAGYFRVDLERCRIEPLIQEAEHLIHPLLHLRAQTLEVHVLPDLPDVHADGRRLIQVLINLLANATKFGPRGDTIQIWACEEGDSVAISVTDHGPGLALKQDRLFERFVRPGAGTQRAQGAGLGLSIVKAIIERHGGTVRVLSRPDAGTTFTIAIPVAKGELHEDLAR